MQATAAGTNSGCSASKRATAGKVHYGRYMPFNLEFYRARPPELLVVGARALASVAALTRLTTLCLGPSVCLPCGREEDCGLLLLLPPLEALTRLRRLQLAMQVEYNYELHSQPVDWGPEKSEDVRSARWVLRVLMTADVQRAVLVCLTLGKSALRVVMPGARLPCASGNSTLLNT